MSWDNVEPETTSTTIMILQVVFEDESPLKIIWRQVIAGAQQGEVFL